MKQRCIRSQGCAGGKLALEGHLLLHFVISLGSLLGDTSSLMMLQVHKVTPWWIGKQVSLPGLSLTGKAVKNAGTWLDAGRAEDVWHIQVAHQSDTFVLATLNVHRSELKCDRNRRFSTARSSSWMFWCVTAGEQDQSSSMSFHAWRCDMWTPLSGRSLNMFWALQTSRQLKAAIITRSVYSLSVSEVTMRCDTNGDVHTDAFHFYLVAWIVLIKSVVFNSIEWHWQH